MAWHDGWRAMRGRDPGRTWMTNEEFRRAMREHGFELSYQQVWLAIKRGDIERPESVYGHFRFTASHVEQLRASLESRALRRRNREKRAGRSGDTKKATRRVLDVA